MAVYTVKKSNGDVLLANEMPKAEYMYGCTATSTAMLLGYYDLYGYHGNSMTNLIEGKVEIESRGTDGNAYDMDAFDTVLGKATASEGYVYRFHSRDGVETTPEQELAYTYKGDTTELNTAEWDSIADYIGTGQYWRGNSNLTTTTTYCSLNDLYTKNYSNGTLKNPSGTITRTVPYRCTSLLYGLDLYVQSRGYTLDRKKTGTYEIDKQGGSFTFADYMAEIDDGRPVLVSIEGHTMIGYGYNASTQEIIFDDCYRSDMRMKWGGTYEYSGKNRAIQSITIITFQVSEQPTPTDMVAPKVSDIKASTTSPTNQNVTVTATFSDNVKVASALYRIGESGKWTVYSNGVTVSENTTVYFKAIDSSDNESEIKSYKVTNIDKTPPAKPTAAADITAQTTKPVSVTATFSSDSAKKEYSLDNKTWKTYSGAIRFTSNGTVYFRGTDAAGNVSAVTSYKVSNIKGATPDPDPDPYDTSDCDDGKNNWLYDKKKTPPRNPDSNFVTTTLTKVNVEVPVDKGSISHTGLHNYVGYGDETDFAKITLSYATKLVLAIDASGPYEYAVCSLSTSTDKKGNTKYTVKSLLSGTEKNGNNTLVTKDLLLEKGNYYISVHATNAKSGGGTYYNVRVDPDSKFYTKGNNDDDWDDLATYGKAGKVGNYGTLDKIDGFVITDWVGFGDTVDYKKFTLNSAAKLSVEIDAYAPVKISVCQFESKTNKNGVTTYSLKTLRTATTKVQFSDGVWCVVADPVFLEKGDYYFRVESTTAKKGADAKYSIYLANYKTDHTKFYTQGNNNDDWEDLKTKGAAGHVGNAGGINGSTTFVLSDWVGFGDAVDYNKFSLSSDAKLSFEVYATDAAKFSVYQIVEKRKKGAATTYSLKSLASVSVKKGKTAKTKAITLEAGTYYYFSMESTNAKKGGDAAYTVEVGSYQAVAHHSDVLTGPEDNHESLLGYAETCAGSASGLAMPETASDSLAAADSLSFGGYETDALADAAALDKIAAFDDHSGWLNLASLA